MNRHPWWYDQVKREQLSGGDFISNFNQDKAGEAEYHITAPEAGEYEFWVRANPIQARLSYRLNDGAWTEIDFGKTQLGNVNIAADNKPDLRFVAWIKAGQVTLRGGANNIRFRMDSQNNNHGYLDCFVLTNEPFQPQGILKPDQLAEAARRIAAENQGWFPFAPKPDPFRDDSGFDLRSLNEKFAGEHGFIAVKGTHFVHGDTGRPLRFWAVNGPPHELKDRESLRSLARLLAKYGVNLVRIHGGYFDENGDVKPESVRHAIDVVECMKAEGIYSHFSIYFPLWLKPKPGTPWLPGYDGNKHPFAALYFNRDFQEKYRSWWKALLLTPSSTTGKPLIAEPAVAGCEMINEDSYFFWTFSPDNIPDRGTANPGKAVRRLGAGPIRLARRGAEEMERPEDAAGRAGRGPLELPPAVEHVQRKASPRQRHRPVPAGEPAAILRADAAVPAQAGIQGPDHGLELGHGQPAGVRAAGEVQLHRGRFHRPARLLRLQLARRGVRVVDPRRAHVQRPQRVAIRAGGAGQAQGVRPPGDGPQLRRQAVDDLRDDVLPAQSLPLRGPAVLRRVRRAAGHRCHRPLCPGQFDLDGQARLLHAAVDADDARHAGPVPRRRTDLPHWAGAVRRHARRSEPQARRLCWTCKARRCRRTPRSTNCG